MKRRDFLLRATLLGILALPVARALCSRWVARHAKGGAIPENVLHITGDGDASWGIAVVTLALPWAAYIYPAGPHTPDDALLVLVGDNFTVTGRPTHFYNDDLYAVRIRRATATLYDLHTMEYNGAS